MIVFEGIRAWVLRRENKKMYASYMYYTLPRVDNLPNYSVYHSSTTCPGNPLEIKGRGEVGAIGLPLEVINAITDTVGNNNPFMPATPAAVWTALQDMGIKLVAA